MVLSMIGNHHRSARQLFPTLGYHPQMGYNGNPAR